VGSLSAERQGFPLRPLKQHMFSRKNFSQEQSFFTTFDLGSKLYLSFKSCSTMNNFFIVVYRKKEGGTDLRELTSNVALTTAMLEAQGFIIIDIIDIGRNGG